MKRILTALVALPILLYTIWSPIPYFFVALAAVVAVLGVREFYSLASKTGLKPNSLCGYLAALLILACFVVSRLDLILAILAALTFVGLFVELERPDDFSKSLASASATVFGVIYIALLLGFLVGLRMTPDSIGIAHFAPKLMTTFFAIVMLTDAGAYYTGRAFGRHKLAPKVSPGKTVEGAIGGFFTGILAALLCGLSLFKDMPAWDAAILGASISAVGQVGDLVESMLKRGSAVKDSSGLIPGHGGMLDRLDSILVAAPLIYFYSRFVISTH
jgi:phosphatidate cytidylyltransferase